jgi:hypothetical protein
LISKRKNCDLDKETIIIYNKNNSVKVSYSDLFGELDVYSDQNELIQFLNENISLFHKTRRLLFHCIDRSEDLFKIFKGLPNVKSLGISCFNSNVLEFKQICSCIQEAYPKLEYFRMDKHSDTIDAPDEFYKLINELKQLKKLNMIGINLNEDKFKKAIEFHPNIF